MLSSREIYNRVEKLRKEKGLSVNELSTAAGISHSTLNSWKIRGTMPKLEILDGICYALGTHLAALLYDMDIKISHKMKSKCLPFGSLSIKHKRMR